jgi:hypothetical protein
MKTTVTTAPKKPANKKPTGSAPPAAEGGDAPIEAEPSLTPTEIGKLWDCSPKLVVDAVRHRLVLPILRRLLDMTAPEEFDLDKKPILWQLEDDGQVIDLVDGTWEGAKSPVGFIEIRVRDLPTVGKFVGKAADYNFQPTLPTRQPLAPVEVEPMPPEDPCKVFREMQNLSADDVTITFVGDKDESGLAKDYSLKISANGKTKAVEASELGLIDRNRKRLNAPGKILLALTLDVAIPKANKKAVSRLRVLLRQRLKINGDLFDLQSTGWVPRFKITDNRGASDKRAEENGEDRSELFDENSGEHNVSGNGAGENDSTD